MHVLVDTSVWIDHFRKKNATLVSLLEQNLVLMHSAVLGELACGNLKKRTEILEYLNLLPFSKEVSTEEALEMVERRHLYGKGLSWIDINLLASSIVSNAHLWTNDKILKKFS